MVETFQTIAQWCEETFGPATAERIASRAAEEMDELLADPHKVEEAADIVIILSRHPTLWAEVERKMAVNRERQWRLMGDGSGYHIPAPGMEAGAPHPDSATPSGDGGESATSGEIEGLVDRLIEAARSRGAKGMACAMQLPSACAQCADADDKVQSARTALLSRITSPSSGGELEALSRKATQGKWTVFHRNGVVEVQNEKGKPVIHWSGFDQRGGSRQKWLADASYIAALANANRAALSASAANPQE